MLHCDQQGYQGISIISTQDVTKTFTFKNKNENTKKKNENTKVTSVQPDEADLTENQHMD